MKQKNTQMRLRRYLFTALLTLLFVGCGKGRSSEEPKPNNGEQTTVSNGNNIVRNEISSDDYYLSVDSLTLFRWKNYSTQNLDMNRDPRLRKITSIGKYAFYGCRRLTSVNISSSITSIEGEAFQGCDSLISVTIPSSVTSIGKRAFLACVSLTNVTIPSSVTSIGESAFSYCHSLTSVNIPSSVTSIGKSAFKNCRSLTSINIPSSVTSIGESAFSGCSSLIGVNIPSSVTSIGWSAFRYCDRLTSVTIPSSVTSIGTSAFSDCESLTSVVFKGNKPPKIEYSFHDRYKVFDETPSNLKLIVPKGAKNAYIDADYPADKLVEE